MNKHTFKVGDRVKSVGYVNSRARGDEYGTIVEVSGLGMGVNFDRKAVNRDDGRWFLLNNEVQHDTDFQVGDWVRYEGVVENYIASLEGHVGTITEAHSNSARVQFPGITDVFLTANLVKIQPPQEAHVKPMNIKHEKYGVVEGVNVLQGGLDHGFTKDGAHYFVGNGWSQVPEIEWVTIQVEKEAFDQLKGYENLYGYSDEALVANEFTRWRYPQ